MGYWTKTWMRAENTELLECYYASSPRERGYMQRMWDEWQSMDTSKPTIKANKEAAFSPVFQQPVTISMADIQERVSKMRAGQHRPPL